ncbi:hypothetical protein B0H19DRAFT_1252226 [Mycena capillaripes]|nr:hypothetical protein B0H19DRAFT_1252226 [Mycena capillaripes]
MECSSSLHSPFWSSPAFAAVVVPSAKYVTIDVVNRVVHPDGFSRSAVLQLANGNSITCSGHLTSVFNFPGPIITAIKAQTLVVKFNNKLTDNTMRLFTSIDFNGVFIDTDNIFNEGFHFVTFDLFLWPEHILHLHSALLVMEREAGSVRLKLSNRWAHLSFSASPVGLNPVSGSAKLSSKPSYSITDVPPEIWSIIARFSSRQSLGRLCSVSREFCTVFSALLYSDVISAPITASQSSLLIRTLSTEEAPSWKPHPATLLRQLRLTSGRGFRAMLTTKAQALAATVSLTNTYRFIAGAESTRTSALRALHWDLAAWLDGLGEILKDSAPFPNLKELVLTSDGTNKTFDVLQVEGLEILGLDFTLSAYNDLIETLNMIHFPALAVLDLSLDLNTDENYGDEPDVSSDFYLFLSSHPNILDLTLCAPGTTLTDDITFLPRLRSFTGSFEHAAIIFDSYGSNLKSTNQLSPASLVRLASSFPNLTHLDICINGRMAEYIKTLTTLTTLQNIRLQEYRPSRNAPTSWPLTKIFPPGEYATQFTPLLPFLPQLAYVEICVMSDHIDSYSDLDSDDSLRGGSCGPNCRCNNLYAPTIFSAPQMKADYCFSVIRGSAKPHVVLDHVHTD